MERFHCRRLPISLTCFALACTPVAAPGGEYSPDLVQKARAVLETNCYRCHGKDGKAEAGVYVLDRQRLVARRKILPGKAAQSPLYKLAASDDMPPAGETPRPGKDDVEVLRQWVEAGAPDFARAVAARSFLSPDDVLQALLEDLKRINPKDRPFTRYFTLTHLYNAGLDEDALQTYRHGLAKLVNSLSWNRAIKKPLPIDPAKTILRIDLRDYLWDEKIWLAVLARNPYGVTYDTPVAKEVYAATACPLPYIRADWFVFLASRPPLYHELLGLPATVAELEKGLKVDVESDLRLQQHVARAGFNGSGVSDNNRVIERHKAPLGAYWRSYDFASSAGVKNVFDHPLDLQPDGGEILFNLPNGLQAYMLVNARGERIDKGPAAIVHDDKQRERAVVNGVSCMSCHARGINEKADQVRKVVENSLAFSPKDRDAVAALYPTEDVFSGYLREDADRFRKALEETGDHLQQADTVVLLAARFDEELDVKQAAAEAGLQPTQLLQGLKVSIRVARVLGPLLVEGGTVKREVFVQAFADLVQDLRLGTFQAPGGASGRSPAALEKTVENSAGMRFVLIPPGTFLMGSPKKENGRFDNEGPQARVEMPRPTYMGVFPVTKGQFAAFVKDEGYQTEAEKAGAQYTWRNPDFDQTDNDPVVETTWNDAMKFCQWLSKKEGKTYELPTEAEWEYACRAGTTTAYSFGDDAGALGDFAWCADNSGNHTHPVGGKKPNPWGLFDMHGNVWQWCADGKRAYQEGTFTDPRGAEDAVHRVARGGSWASFPRNCRSAFRTGFDPGNRVNVLGFRVVLRPGGRAP